MATATDTAAILTLAQWFSPGFPVGAFSYSHGLEWTIETGEVTGADALHRWIVDVLRHGSGRSDATFLAAAFHVEDTEDLKAIDDACRAFAPSRERLLETAQQGAAFCGAVSAVWRCAPRALTYPVAVGHAAAHCGLPPVLTASMYLHSFAANLVSVGIRLIPLGQTKGQALIHALSPVCQKIAQDTAAGDLYSLTGTAFLADIAAMKHETQYSRVFRT